MDFCECRIVVELAAQPKNCINESGGTQRGKNYYINEPAAHNVAKKGCV